MSWFNRKKKVVVEQKQETTSKPATKTAATKTSKPAAKTSNKAPTNTYYLTARKDKSGKKVGWEVKRGNAKVVSAVCDTKEEAMDKVKQLAKNSKATVKIYKLDGTVEKSYKIN